MTVHVDRLVKAQERPIDLQVIPSDLTSWIPPQGEDTGSGLTEEMMEEPQVTRKQRSADDRAKNQWSIDKIIDSKVPKKGQRKYEVRFTGYTDPKDDLWHGIGKRTCARWERPQTRC